MQTFLEDHLYLLGIFIALLLVAGVWGLFQQGIKWRSFGLMNILGAVIDLAILLVLKTHILSNHFFEPGELHMHILKMIGFNLLLDIAYGFLGAIIWFWPEGKIKARARLKGFAYGIILNAAGLFILDIVTWLRVFWAKA